MKACLILALAFLAGCGRCKCPCCAQTEVKTMAELEAEWEAEGPQDLSEIDWSEMVYTNGGYRVIEWILAHPYERLPEDFQP